MIAQDNVTKGSESQDILVGTATDYRLDDRMIGVRIPARARNFSLRHRAKTGSGAHPASYATGIGGSFSGGKEADHSFLSRAEVKECVGLFLHATNTYSWRGA
jgi:hypothetical protein